MWLGNCVVMPTYFHLNRRDGSVEAIEPVATDPAAVARELVSAIESGTTVMVDIRPAEGSAPATPSTVKYYFDGSQFVSVAKLTVPD
jgi:hypothetical protein